MCSRKIYDRFLKLYEYIRGSIDFTRKSASSCGMMFKTNLGDRYITMFKWDNGEIELFYHEELDEFKNPKVNLFHIAVQKSGKISVNSSKIEDLEIFLAIYEIESLIFNKSRDNILEKLFESTNNRFNIFNFTQYR